jgi:hypothetical protein
MEFSETTPFRDMLEFFVGFLVESGRIGLP